MMYALCQRPFIDVVSDCKWLVLSLVLMVGCADPAPGPDTDVCGLASAHLAACTGETVAGSPTECDEDLAQEVLGSDCGSINESFAAGKADEGWDSVYDFMCEKLGFDSYCEAVSISAGHAHVCVTRTNGSVGCWGSNLFGQAGSKRPLLDEPRGVSGLENVVEVSAGVFHTCARHSNGTVSCWGLNQSGELGDAQTYQSHEPMKIAGLEDVTQVVSGNGRSCALHSDTTVSCWGGNIFGDLGIGSVDAFDHPNPKKVTGLGNVVQLASGWHHVCALLQSGSVSCWGGNFNGELGRDTGEEFEVPVHGEVTGLVAEDGDSPIVKIVAGETHTCALKQDGGLWCWGRNERGQAGLDASDKPVPATEITTGVADVTLGAFHTCVKMNEGSVQCWGDNRFGQMGAGAVGEEIVTSSKVSLPSVSDLAGGSYFTCALLQGGGGMCWGQGDSGQLGDDTRTPRTSPVAVEDLL
jgi:alpha-tubulin suppressor-like RCC1 family protein